MKQFKNKGFSLLEILLVLAIAAALVIGAFMVYPKVKAAQQADIEAKNISTIVAGVKTLYGSVSNYKGLDNTVAINAKIVPENMLDGTPDGIYSSFKGAVTISANGNTHSGEDDSGFFIRYVRLMPEVCSKLVSNVQSTFYEINVNGTYAKEYGEGYDAAKATQLCNISGSGNYVIFYAE